CRACRDVPSVIGNLAKTVRPVIAPPSEHLHRPIVEVSLYAIAIERYPINPGRAGGYLFDRSCQRRFNEAWEWRLNADRGWLFALERHGQAKRMGSGRCMSRYCPS